MIANKKRVATDAATPLLVMIVDSVLLWYRMVSLIGSPHREMSCSQTAVDRCEHDGLVVNPECPMKGIPVSLRVPTHMELSVIETTYWEKKIKPGQKPELVRLSTCRPTRSVTHKICETEKVFLVDPVRPGAGIANYGFTFQSNNEDATKAKNSAGKGYLSNVQYKIDDQTIKESAKLFANSLGLINALQVSANQGNPNSSDLITTERAVAYARFDINSPSYEMDVAAFLDCNVNLASNQCNPTVVCK